ncbi:MAG TPA: hypothetical protein DD670_20100, partial [Planctomycetaceae bacterium]|nr:hypothetical protein [Planctomycetaceae bacterium]
MSRVALVPISLALLLAFASVFASQGSPALADEASRTVVKTGNIPRELLDGPLADVEEVVFAVRVSGRDHWYANFGYYC